MKRLTTIICCVAMMILGVATAFQDFSMPGNQTAFAQPAPLTWNLQPGKLPLDLQLTLDERLKNEIPTRDSINIIDSIRYIDKVRWKTRYKTVADRTTAREVGQHPAPVNPDSMLENPTIISTMGREEQPIENVGVTKMPSIQLTVDGNVVYSTNDNHSEVGGQ